MSVCLGDTKFNLQYLGLLVFPWRTIILKPRSLVKGPSPSSLSANHTSPCHGCTFPLWQVGAFCTAMTWTLIGIFFSFFFFIPPPGSVMKTFSMLWLSCYSSPLWFKHQIKTEPILNAVLILPSLCHLDTDSSAFCLLPSVWFQTHSLTFSEFLQDHWKWFSEGTKATVLYRAAGVCPVTDFVPVTQLRAWGRETSPHFTSVYAEVTLRTRTFRTQSHSQPASDTLGEKSLYVLLGIWVLCWYLRQVLVLAVLRLEQRNR